MAGNRIRKSVMGITLVLVAAGLAGCDRYEPNQTGVVRVNGNRGDLRMYLEYQDPSFDDKGPGRYTYPLIVEKTSQRESFGKREDGTTVTHPLEEQGTQNFPLDNRRGFFDITSFEIIDDGNNIVFEIGTERPIPRFRSDGSSEGKGWFLQLMDIYIDKDHKAGSGRTRMLPGRNLEFPPEQGWEQAIMVTPQYQFDLRRLIEQITWDLDFVEMKKDIYIPDVVFVSGYKFRVQVPREIVGDPQPGWGYQVCMMLFDPSNLRYGHFQQGRVQRFAGNNVFGGGDEYEGHPNVLDILAPTPEDQYRAMSQFVSAPNRAENRYAVIQMVYPGRTAPPPQKYQMAQDPAGGPPRPRPAGPPPGAQGPQGPPAPRAQPMMRANAGYAAPPMNRANGGYPPAPRSNSVYRDAPAPAPRGNAYPVQGYPIEDAYQTPPAPRGPRRTVTPNPVYGDNLFSNTSTTGYGRM